MLLGIALIVSGAAVLIVMRRALWPRPEDEEAARPPRPENEASPEYDDGAGPVDDPEYGTRPIYVPAERGTVYVSRSD